MYDDVVRFGLIGDSQMFRAFTRYDMTRKDVTFSVETADSIFLILGIK